MSSCWRIIIFPGELEEAIRGFVEYYNNERYHESLKNMKPVDVYEGKGHVIQNERRKIKQETVYRRRLENQAVNMVIDRNVEVKHNAVVG